MRDTRQVSTKLIFVKIHVYMYCLKWQENAISLPFFFFSFFMLPIYNLRNHVKYTKYRQIFNTRGILAWKIINRLLAPNYISYIIMRNRAIIVRSNGRIVRSTNWKAADVLFKKSAGWLDETSAKPDSVFEPLLNITIGSLWQLCFTFIASFNV